MSTPNLLPLPIQSANPYLTSPPTPGELLGEALGAPYGPIGVFVGGTIGRIIERKLFG